MGVCTRAGGQTVDTHLLKSVSADVGGLAWAQIITWPGTGLALYAGTSVFWMYLVLST